MRGRRPQCVAGTPAHGRGDLLAAAETIIPGGVRAYSPATLRRWLAGIGYHHRRVGHPAPSADELVTATMSGIRRDYATAGNCHAARGRRCTADVLAIIDKARASCGGWADEAVERRDSAILLLGFAGAFRRSELVAPTCGDISLHRLDGVQAALDEALPELARARATIEQAKAALMPIYGISAERGFDVLAWRSQETNTKFRALAEHLVASMRTDLQIPTDLRSSFDNLLPGRLGSPPRK